MVPSYIIISIFNMGRRVNRFALEETFGECLPVVYIHIIIIKDPAPDDSEVASAEWPLWLCRDYGTVDTGRRVVRVVVGAISAAVAAGCSRPR